MFPIQRPPSIALATLAGLVAQPAAASCGSAFCSVNTSAAFMGGDLSGATRADLRFEFIDQKQPRQGSHNVAVGEVSAHHDEVRTTNRNWLASIEHDLSRDWTLGLTLPLIDRSHDHIHNHHHDGEVLHIPDSLDFRELGDLRLSARHALVSDSAPAARRATPSAPMKARSLRCAASAPT